MDTCTSRRGFLVLSSCGAPALRPCAACGSMTCPEHLSPSSGLSECLACAHRSGRANPKTKTNDSRTSTDHSSYDSDDSYRYRQSYYRDSHYDPSPSSFDRSDTRSFVAGSAAAAVLDDDAVGAASFGDS